MDSSPSPTNSQHTSNISADALAAAAERRTREATPLLTAAQLAAEHERRQKFRRLIDPGITRPNSKERAFSSLKVQHTYCFPLSSVLIWVSIVPFNCRPC